MKIRGAGFRTIASARKVAAQYNRASLAAYEYLVRNPNTVMFGLGVALLVGGLTELSAAQDYSVGVTAAGGSGVGGNPVQACSRVLGYIEGGFGALIATGAGLGAIVAAALGGFKAAWCLIVVSVGSFILRSYITLFHSPCRNT